MKLRTLLITGAICLAPSLLFAAGVQISTTDGNVVRGELVSLSNGVYTIKTAYGVITIPAASVKSIETEGSPAPTPTPTPTSTPTESVSGPPVLHLAGSTTVGDELAPALLEAFATKKGTGDLNWSKESEGELSLEAKGPNNAVFDAHLSRHGSGTAFTAIADGKADIGMASRRVNKKETDMLTGKGLGNFLQPGQENVLALDGLIVLANKKNPMEGISIANIRDIFSGKITDWSQIGGSPGKIDVFVRDDKSGTHDTFNALVMSGVTTLSSAVVVTDNNEMTDKVQSDPNAIGYAGFAYLGSNKALTIGTDCGLSYPPDELYVRTEEYPLSRRLYLYQAQSPTNPDQQAFIDFSLGPDGQGLVKKNNFIDLTPVIGPSMLGRQAVAIDFVDLTQNHNAIPLDYQMFAVYAQRATYGNRVTTTFRFATDSSDLDSRAVRDIDRLADFLKGQNRKVLIAGFTDSIGAADYDVRLAADRANRVADLLRAKGVQPNEVRGFGRVAPVACNTTPEGRDKNRRVEVWLY